MMRLDDRLARMRRQSGNAEQQGLNEKILRANGYCYGIIGKAEYMIRQQGDDLIVYKKDGRTYFPHAEYVRKAEA